LVNDGEGGLELWLALRIQRQGQCREKRIN